MFKTKGRRHYIDWSTAPHGYEGNPARDVGGSSTMLYMSAGLFMQDYADEKDARYAAFEKTLA